MDQATEATSFIINSQNSNRMLWQQASHRGFDCCQMCLLQGSPPSVVCLKWVLLLWAAKCAWCMYRRLNSPVFLGTCWTTAALREEDRAVTWGLSDNMSGCVYLWRWIPLLKIQFKGASYPSCACVFGCCWEASCRLCRHCCLSSCCTPAAHRCQAESSMHSGNSPSTSWDPVCLCLDGTALKWTSGQKKRGSTCVFDIRFWAPVYPFFSPFSVQFSMLVYLAPDLQCGNLINTI